MRSKLKTHTDFPTFTPAKDLITLIMEMRNIICGREDHMQDAWSLAS